MKQYVLQSIIADDTSLIPYRKELNHLTGSVTATILLTQILYWWKNKKRTPFYKFRTPCKHDDYKLGDSWCEELGFGEKELDNAISAICEKVREVRKDKIQGSKEVRGYVRCWQTMDRKTYYEVNEELLETDLKDLFERLANPQNGDYVTYEKEISQPTNRGLDYIDTENTQKNTTENTKGFSDLDNKQHEQAQPNQLHLEQKKESHPLIPLAPPPLKTKGKKDRASIAIPTSLNNADFLVEWEKLLQTKKWKSKEDSTLEGILEKLSTFDVRFATELANQARLNEWQGIIFAQTSKSYEMWLKSNPQSTNSPETVQLSVLANSGLKTLKIARKCKAYEIAESLVDKQTGFILTEAISQEAKNHIAWITRNITTHINNNTIEKQEWFCGFVVRKN